MDFFVTSGSYGRAIGYITLFLLVYCFLLWRPKNYWGKIITLFVVSEFFICWMLYLFEPTTLFNGLVKYLEVHFYDPKYFGKLSYPLKLFWVYFTFGVLIKIYCYMRYLLSNRNLYLALVWSPLSRDIEPPFKGILTGEYEIRKSRKKRSLLLLFGYLFVLTLLTLVIMDGAVKMPSATSDFPYAISHISIDTWFSVTLLKGMSYFFFPALCFLIIKDWGIYLFRSIRKLYFLLLKEDSYE